MACSKEIYYSNRFHLLLEYQGCSSEMVNWLVISRIWWPTCPTSRLCGYRPASCYFSSKCQGSYDSFCWCHMPDYVWGNLRCSSFELSNYRTRSYHRPIFELKRLLQYDWFWRLWFGKYYWVAEWCFLMVLEAYPKSWLKNLRIFSWSFFFILRLM